MTLFCGTPEESWLYRDIRPDIPMCVSRNRLARRRAQSLRSAVRRWMLDSAGFTELQKHGHWRMSAERYAQQVLIWTERLGMPEFIAQQDWMCEQAVIDGGRFAGMNFLGTRTFLDPRGVATVAELTREHQRRTVQNLLELRALVPHLPIAPVLQGNTPDSYFECWEMFRESGVDLIAEPVVGLGSVCRRQATEEIRQLISTLRIAGLRLHGFGVKTGAHKYGYLLESADSMAWSTRARMLTYHGRSAGLGCAHRSCANCVTYAANWWDQHILMLDRSYQADLFEHTAGVAQ
jgi:hypothetical protein